MLRCLLEDKLGHCEACLVCLKKNKKRHLAAHRGSEEELYMCRHTQPLAWS